MPGRRGSENVRRCRVLAVLVRRVGPAPRLPDRPDAREPSQLDDRLRMVLDAQVADAIDALAGCVPGAGALDHNGRRLLPAPVAAGSLTGFEGSDQALDQPPDR